jgi:ATP-dependent protease ClpP protease subunit
MSVPTRSITTKLYIDEENDTLQLYIVDFEMDDTIADVLQSLEQVCTTGEVFVLNIHINSFGGDTVIGFQLLEVLERIVKTGIPVNVRVYQCQSMAAILLVQLAKLGANIILSDYSYMMVHQVSCEAAETKISLLTTQLSHENEYYKRCLIRIFDKFLTKKELKTVLQGQEIYFLQEDIQKKIDGLKIKVNNANDSSSV